MRRSWLIWIGFLLSLAVVVTAMAWVSWTAVRLDATEAQTRRQAVLEEKVRLALWRADSTLAPLVAQESVRPWFAYRALLPADQAYNRLFNDKSGGRRLLPSPLLAAAAPNVLVYFQVEPDGRLTSPQVPEKANLSLAVPRYASQQAIDQAKRRLDEVQSLLQRTKLLALLPECPSNPMQIIVLPSPAGVTSSTLNAPAPPSGPAGPQGEFTPNSAQPQSPLAQSSEQRAAVQKRRADIQRESGPDAVDFDVRNNLIMQQKLANNYDINGTPLFGNGTPGYGDGMGSAKEAALRGANTGGVIPSTDMSGVPMTPLWIDGRLILARRVVAGGQEYVQGCLLDWLAIKTVLLETIADLLPEADIEPVPGPRQEESRMLAALPVRLLPGAVGHGGENLLTPILLSLAVAWTCMLLAAMAVAGLLAGAIRLSQRRASFVTAVTHELRTPLTTFQMYAEMLAEGMVPPGPQQRQYLATLRAEAVRLTHLVENVLCYARLERGRNDGRRESVALGALVERMKDRLAARLEQADMVLSLDSAEGAGCAVVRTNPSAIEQILFNLVDNACKYASGGADHRVHMQLRADGRQANIRLWDHGPGISPSVRRRLFRPFSKSAREAAHSAPGVGLGLALSRRLARDLDGDLRLDEAVCEGACFVLVLPLVAEP